MDPRNSKSTLGISRGAPRIYLVGKWLPPFGFEVGLTFRVDYFANSVKLVLDAEGDRLIAQASVGDPILQVQDSKLVEVFGSEKIKLAIRTTEGCIEIQRAR